MTTNVLLDLSSVVVPRAALFLGCRRYLLRNLYHDLQDLSTAEIGVSADIELDVLPTPTSAKPSTRSLPLHFTLAQTLFSLCFTDSCMLFLALVCQALNLVNTSTLLLNWRISLGTLLVTILVLTPISISVVLMLGSGSTADFASAKGRLAFRVCLCLFPLVPYSIALSYVPLPPTLPPNVGVLTTALARLIVVGTVILGMLSGFGAVSNAWGFLPWVNTSRKTPTADAVASAERSLNRVREDIVSRLTEIKRFEDNASPKSQSSWFSRASTSLRGDSQAASLKQELNGLEALEYQMSRNYEDLKQRRLDAEFSQSFRGKLYGVLGRLFAVYCIVRIISCMFNLVVPRPSGTTKPTYPDLITHALASILALFPSVHVNQEDIVAVARQTSLAMVGIIILSSIRLVLRGATRMLRVTSRNTGASLMMLILEQLMGIYFLSTIVQLRTSFPPPATATNLFLTIPEFEVFGSMFDGSFLLAAIVYGIVRWTGERVNGGGVDNM